LVGSSIPLACESTSHDSVTELSRHSSVYSPLGQFTSGNDVDIGIEQSANCTPDEYLLLISSDFLAVLVLQVSKDVMK